MKGDSEYEKFDKLMSDIVKVPHDKVAHQLEREKNTKKKRKPKKKASVHASREKD